LIAHGAVASAGLSGSTTVAVDLRSGASSTADRNSQFGQQTVVTSTGTWKQDFTLGVHPYDSPDALAAARTSRYLARRGYFRASKDPAEIGCVSDEIENGRSLRRVVIVPSGGRPVTVWIDPEIPAIIRTQEQAPTDVFMVEYADFRDVHGLRLPYKITESDARPEDTLVRTIQSYEPMDALNASDFQRPADPTNQRIAGGNSTQMEVDLDSGSPVVNA